MAGRTHTYLAAIETGFVQPVLREIGLILQVSWIQILLVASVVSANNLTVCVESYCSCHALAVATLAFNTSAAHIEAHNFTFVEGIATTQQLPEISIEILDEFEWNTDIIRAGSSCDEVGGDMQLLGASSPPDVTAPLLESKAILPVTVVPRGSLWNQDILYGIGPDIVNEVQGLNEFAGAMGWTKMAVFYCAGDDEYLKVLISSAKQRGLEIHSFQLSSDLETKVAAIKSSGASIMVLTGVTDLTGRVEDFLQSFEAWSKEGLLGDQYTWIGVHRLSSSCLKPLAEKLKLASRADDASYFLTSLIYLEVQTKLTHSSEAVQTKLAHRSEAANSLLIQSARGTFMEDCLTTEGWADHFEDVFAIAYDAMWLAAVARQQQLNGTCPPRNTSEEDPHDPVCHVPLAWCMRSVGGFQGLSGTVQWNATSLESSRTIIWNGLDHLKIAAYMNASGQIDVQAGIVWRNGEVYFGNGSDFIPPSDLSSSGSQDEGGALWAAVAAACFLLALLLAVFFLYMKLQHTLRRIANAGLDLESPISKAATLLEEVSCAMILTPRLRRRSLAAAMALMRAEDVYAPDLSKQADGENQDILSFLTFSNKVNLKHNERSDSEAGRSSEANDSRVLRRRGSLMGLYQIFTGSGSQAEDKQQCGRAHHLGEEVAKAVSTAGQDLFFDTPNLRQNVTDKPLLAVSLQVLNSTGLISLFHLDQRSLIKYIAKIEEGYMDVPYHNATHAADVLSRMCAVLSADYFFTPELSKDKQLLLLAAILAAVVHDYQHPGLNNSFQVKANTAVSREFNEQMVLENLSINRALQLLVMPEYDFLKAMRESRRRELCSMIIALVLATDMNRHFEILSSFKGKILSELMGRPGSHGTPVSRGMRTMGKNKQHEESSRALFRTLNRNFNRSSSMASAPLTLDVLDEKQTVILLQMALKIADVGHSTALFRNHVEWSQRLQEEFFTQGDKEKELNLEISPLMNREKPGVMHPSNQMYFLDVIVIPMLELWTQIGPNAGGSLMAQALHNREQWEQRKTAAVEEP